MGDLLAALNGDMVMVMWNIIISVLLVGLIAWKTVEEIKRKNSIERFDKGVDNLNLAFQKLRKESDVLRKEQQDKMQRYEEVLTNSIAGLENNIQRMQEIVAELNGLRK